MLVFCRRCGAYSVGRTHALGSVCKRAPENHATKSRLAMMLDGRHPVKHFYVGKPLPLNGKEEWETLAAFNAPAATLDEATPHD